MSNAPSPPLNQFPILRFIVLFVSYTQKILAHSCCHSHRSSLLPYLLCLYSSYLPWQPHFIFFFIPVPTATWLRNKGINFSLFFFYFLLYFSLHHRPSLAYAHERLSDKIYKKRQLTQYVVIGAYWAEHPCTIHRHRRINALYICFNLLSVRFDVCVWCCCYIWVQDNTIQIRMGYNRHRTLLQCPSIIYSILNNKWTETGFFLNRLRGVFPLRER